MRGIGQGAGVVAVRRREWRGATEAVVICAAALILAGGVAAQMIGQAAAQDNKAQEKTQDAPKATDKAPAKPAPAAGAPPAAANNPAVAKPAPVQAPADTSPDPKRVTATFAPVAFKDLPGWARDEHVSALSAFRQSCRRLLDLTRSGTFSGKPPSPALLAACAEAGRLPARVTGAAARAFFEAQFTPHKVVHAGPAGMVTGYYEPLLAASRVPTPQFQVPIYRRPPDLVELTGAAQNSVPGLTLNHGLRTPSGIVAAPTREEIDKGALEGRGLELFYLADAVDAFILHIEGSGRLRFADGSMTRVSYDGKNGHPYSSVGRHLIDQKVIGAERMSMQSLTAYVRSAGERGLAVLWHNKSYVFFRENTAAEAKAPLGVAEIPLTPGRSLAVDAAFHVIGTPVYVSAPTLVNALKAGEFHRLMVAQDVGSAIKGPERGDIYLGSGRAAGRIAGVVKHPASFFVLLPVEPGSLPVPPPANSAPGAATKK